MKTTLTSPQHPLHLLRAILREASYHPDPAAQSYLKQYASNSFRTAKIRLATSRPWGPEKRRQREVHLTRSARRFHSILKRSNEGYLVPFRKTLSLTYGRTGQRRRPLMKQIMRVGAQPEPTEEAAPFPVDERAQAACTRADAPAYSAMELFQPTHGESDTAKPSGHAPPALEPRSKIRLPPRAKQQEPYVYSPGISVWPKRHYLPFTPDKIPPMFQALSISQSAAADRIPDQSRSNQPEGPKLPETTIWGRPMPECRTRNAMLKWFAREAALLYPYLPPNEWSYIRGIALGTTRLTVPARRPTASTRVFTSAEPCPTPSLLDRPEAEPRYQGRKHGNPHRMTPRFLTREYERLLRHVPLLIGGEGEAAYGSAPTLPPLVTPAQPQSDPPQTPDMLKHQPPKGGTTSVSTATQEDAVAVEKKLTTRSRRRPTGVFLWHSTVLEKPKPRKMIPQSLGTEPNRLLFG